MIATTGEMRLLASSPAYELTDHTLAVARRHLLP